MKSNGKQEAKTWRREFLVTVFLLLVSCCAIFTMSLRSTERRASTQRAPLRVIEKPHYESQRQKVERDKLKQSRLLIATRREQQKLKVRRQKVMRLQPDRKWVPKPGLRTEDFLIAIPGHRDQELVFAAGRQARRGLQTYMATSYQPSARDLYPSSANETWGFYPDDNPKRSWYPGDSRAALTPFLAYNALRHTNFSWLMYGDDDTVFFLDAAKEVVKDLDPQQPYFLTDNIWWGDTFASGYHPHPNAPHCDTTCSGPLSHTNPLDGSPACPCIPEAMCRSLGYRKWDVKGCDPPDSFAMHGGAGGLFSVGLLRSIDPVKMEACVLRQQDSGGDSFLTSCLWQQNVAPTWPDSGGHPRGLPTLDPSPGPLHPDDFIMDKAAYVLANLLLDAVGACTVLCKLELQRTVSIHLRARRIGGSQQGTAAFIRMFSRLAAGNEDSRPAQASDVLDKVSASLASQADAAVVEGLVVLRHLLQALKGTEKLRKAGYLDIRREGVAPIPLRDSILTATAKTVAEQVLHQLLYAAKPLATRGFEDDSCANTARKPTWS